MPFLNIIEDVSGDVSTDLYFLEIQNQPYFTVACYSHAQCGRLEIFRISTNQEKRKRLFICL